MHAPVRTLDDIEAGLVALRQVDPDFCGVIDKAGPVPLRAGTPGYAGLASIIVAQMVSKAAADSVWRRLNDRLGEISAATVIAAPDPLLREAGLSGAKAAALRRIAAHEMAGEIDLAAIAHRPPAEAMTELVAIKGVGPWTAEVYLLFCAGHPDIFPAGDIALANACAHALGLDSRPEGKALRVLAERWAPVRSIAARVLWAYYATEMRREATPL